MNKTALTNAFKMMRKMGIVARQNFLCCQSCGCAAIDDIVEKKRKAKQPVPLGYCFYHAQDADTLRYSGYVYLAFGAIDDNGDSTGVGNIIVMCLKQCGVRCKWDGNCYTRIKADCTVGEVVDAVC